MSAGRPALRFGLVGTGYWARTVHAPALAATDGVELAAIWGRDPVAAGDLAGRFGALAPADFDDFLAGVDAVSFAVPPDVQADLAIRAAAAGRHLLLEKPVATSLAAADALVGAVADAGVASVVFFRSRFSPAIRAWLADVQEKGGWAGGGAVWLGTALDADSPFNTPWRRQKGGLWDLGPHVLSLLWAGLGPVRAVTADAGAGDITHLILHHESGASSTATVTLAAPPGADGFGAWLWGSAGRTRAPAATDGPADALRIALIELAAYAHGIRDGHECDVRFGRDVVRVLAAAESQIPASRL